MNHTLRDFFRNRVPNPKDFHPLDLSGPIDIEIGCGVGWHALSYAQSHPERQYFAIEKSPIRFEKFKRRINQHADLRNLHPIHANAVSWICHRLEPNTVDQYFFLYPNPYPKNTQHDKRWFRTPFFAYLIETLKVGGTVRFATNCEDYAEQALLWLSKKHRLELNSVKQLDNTFPARTHFEKKYLERGEPCWDIQFTKPNIAKVDQPPVVKPERSLSIHSALFH